MPWYSDYLNMEVKSFYASVKAQVVARGMDDKAVHRKMQAVGEEIRFLRSQKATAANTKQLAVKLAFRDALYFALAK